MAERAMGLCTSDQVSQEPAVLCLELVWTWAHPHKGCRDALELELCRTREWIEGLTPEMGKIQLPT